MSYVKHTFFPFPSSDCAGLPRNWTSTTESVTKRSFEQLFEPLQARFNDCFNLLLFILVSCFRIEPLQGKQLNVISVFSGVGGLELGLRQPEPKSHKNGNYWRVFMSYGQLSKVLPSLRVRSKLGIIVGEDFV